MNSNELTLSVAIIGVVGTIAASIVGHVFAVKRESESWKRDEERQRQQWAREDAAAEDQRRYDAYLTFLRFAERLHGRCHLLWVEPLKRAEAEITIVGDALEEFATSQTAVMVHGSSDARRAVPDLYNAVAELVNAIVLDPDDEEFIETRADASLNEIRRFRAVVRRELSAADDWS